MGGDSYRAELSMYILSRNAMEIGIRKIKSKDPRMAGRIEELLKRYASDFHGSYDWHIDTRNIPPQSSGRKRIVDDAWYPVVFGHIQALTSEYKKRDGALKAMSDPKSYVDWLFQESKDAEDFMVRLQGIREGRYANQ
jgi:hypothetical protein